MVAMAMRPWIPDLVTSSQQIKMADNVSLSFYQVLVTFLAIIWYIRDSEPVLKLNMRINTGNIQATRLQVS